MRHLISLLLNLLLGPMLFAAGASSLGGDGGGGDAGAGSSGDSAGDAGGNEGDSGADSGASDAGGESASAAESGADSGDDQGSDPDAPVDLGDGRQVPAKWKKLFDAAKTQGIEKEVRQLFFANQRLAKTFPGGVNEAVKLAQSVQDFGGVEGLSDLKADNDAFHADAQTFLNDPGKWIESAFTENSEASLKAFSHSLDYVSEKHPEHYDFLMSKVIFNDLKDNSPVGAIYQLLAGMKDNPDARKLANQLSDYYNDRLAISRKVPEKKVDTQLSEREQKIRQTEETQRNHAVNSQTIPLLGRQMTSQIEKIAKEAGFDLAIFTKEQPEAAKSLRGQILNRVMNKAASDKNFIRNYKAVMAQGDTQRAVNMMNKKHGEILGDIVREVARGFGIAKKGGKVSTGNRGAERGADQNANRGGGTGIVRVSSKDEAHKMGIDYGRTPSSMLFDGEAWLKNGKKAVWA